MRLIEVRVPKTVGLLVILAIIFGIPALIPAGIPQLRATPIAPEIVFIGNSMLDSRIHLETFDGLTNHQNTLLLVDSGSGAESWHLRLRDLVADDSKPHVVFIFFRDDALTESRNGSDGRVSDELQDIRDNTGGESLSDSGGADRIDNFVREFYPIQIRRGSVKIAVNQISASPMNPNFVVSTVRRALSIYGIGSYERSDYGSNLTDLNTLLEDVNDVFVAENIRTRDGYNPFSASTPRFDAVVNESYLPIMINLARENSIPVVFVRLQRRPKIDGSTPNSSSLDIYMADLQNYLDSLDIALIDMNGNPDIRREHYADAVDHISQYYTATYTRIFFQIASEYIEP